MFQFKNRREDRERKGSIPYHHTGKKRQRRMGVPFLLHEDHLDVSPTRSTFSFGSFSGLGDDRRALDRGGWQATIMGKTRLVFITSLHPGFISSNPPVGETEDSVWIW